MEQFKKFLFTLSIMAWAMIAIAAFGAALNHGVNAVLAIAALALHGIGAFLYFRSIIKYDKK